MEQTTQHKWAAMLFTERTRLQETQKQFGERFGVDETTVSRWETGKRAVPGRVTWWLMQLKQEEGSGL